MGFVDKLRSARTLGYTNPNIDIDSMLRGAINDEHNMNRQEFNDRRSGGFLSGGGGGGNSRGGYLNRGGGFNNRSEFTNPKPMDVVYDQRPELATKQMNLQKQQMAQDAKLEEAKMALMAMKNNDAYIDNRRDSERKDKETETRDWAARNLKPGEMSDKDKMQAEYNNRHALQTAENVDNWVARREQNAGAERIAGMRGETSNEVAQTRAAAQTEAANIRAEAMAEAARIRNEGKSKDKPVAPVVAAPVNNDAAIHNELTSLLQPGAPQVDNDVQRRAAAQVVGANNVPMVGGIGSAALGTNVGQLGVPAGGIGKGKLDPHTGQLLNPQDSKNSGFVDMVDPKGRPLKVPVNEVDALLKKGAKRR